MKNMKIIVSRSPRVKVVEQREYVRAWAGCGRADSFLDSINCSAVTFIKHGKRLCDGVHACFCCQAPMQSRSRVGHFIIDFHLRVKEPRCHLLADCTFQLFTRVKSFHWLCLPFVFPSLCQGFLTFIYLQHICN